MVVEESKRIDRTIERGRKGGGGDQRWQEGEQVAIRKVTDESRRMGRDCKRITLWSGVWILEQQGLRLGGRGGGFDCFVLVGYSTRTGQIQRKRKPHQPTPSPARPRSPQKISRKWDEKKTTMAEEHRESKAEGSERTITTIKPRKDSIDILRVRGR